MFHFVAHVCFKLEYRLNFIAVKLFLRGAKCRKVRLNFYHSGVLNITQPEIKQRANERTDLGSVQTQEAKYIESWPNTTSAWASWSRFDIPVDRYDGVHSLLICTSITLSSPTCHQASQQENTSTY
jgi:hypothetical protein